MRSRYRVTQLVCRALLALRVGLGRAVSLGRALVFRLLRFGQPLVCGFFLLRDPDYSIVWEVS